MKPEHAHALIEASDDELTLYENYSGRGMFGETTTGVVGSQSAFVAATALAARMFGSDCEAAGFIKEIANLRTDNMAMDMIYY